MTFVTKTWDLLQLCNFFPPGKFLHPFGSQGKGHNCIWKPRSMADIGKRSQRKGCGWMVSSSLGLQGGSRQGVAGGRMLIPSEGSNGCKGTESQAARCELWPLRGVGPSFLCFGGDKAVQNGHSDRTLKCRKQKVFCPLRRVSHFPLRPNWRATALTLRSSFNGRLCSRQEGQPC